MDVPEPRWLHGARSRHAALDGCRYGRAAAHSTCLVPMPWPREILEQVEATYGLFAGEAEDLEPMFRAGNSDEAIVELIYADQAERLSRDQCLQIVQLLRRTLRPRS